MVVEVVGWGQGLSLAGLHDQASRPSHLAPPLQPSTSCGLPWRRLGIMGFSGVSWDVAHNMQSHITGSACLAGWLSAGAAVMVASSSSSSSLPCAMGPCPNIPSAQLHQHAHIEGAKRRLCWQVMRRTLKCEWSIPHDPAISDKCQDLLQHLIVQACLPPPCQLPASCCHAVQAPMPCSCPSEVWCSLQNSRSNLTTGVAAHDVGLMASCDCSTGS